MIIKNLSMKQHSCSLCAMSHICLPLGVDKEDIRRLEALIQTTTTLHAGDIIVRQNDVFDNIYAVKTGTLKSSRVDENGNTHINGFHLPGELFGLDGIYPKRYTCQTETLDTVVLFELNYNQLSDLCIDIPSLHRQLLRLFSREIHISQISQAENAELTAEQKLASFINNLSTRYAVRGYSGTEFKLTMSRLDIARHLGLAPETVSRILKKLSQQNVLDIKNRQVTIINAPVLAEIINCEAA